MPAAQLFKTVQAALRLIRVQIILPALATPLFEPFLPQQIDRLDYLLPGAAKSMSAAARLAHQLDMQARHAVVVLWSCCAALSAAVPLPVAPAEEGPAACYKPVSRLPICPGPTPHLRRACWSGWMPRWRPRVGRLLLHFSFCFLLSAFCL